MKVIWQGTIYLGTDRTFRLVDRNICAHPYPLDLVIEEQEKDAIGELTWNKVDEEHTRLWVMAFVILETAKLTAEK